MSDKVDRGPEPASPTPWVVEPADEGGPAWIEDPDGDPVASIHDGDRADAERNGAAIVHRVNNWDAAMARIDSLRVTLAQIARELPRGTKFDHNDVDWIRDRHPDLFEDPDA